MSYKIEPVGRGIEDKMSGIINKKHKLGRFAKSDDDDAKKERSKAKSKSGGSCLREILCLPFKGLWCSTKSFLTLLGLAFIFKLFGDDE